MWRAASCWYSTCDDANIVVQTQNSEEGLGRLDRHGEERAGVQSFIWQADVANSDGELLWRGSQQLDSVIPQSCQDERHKEPQRDPEKNNKSH